MTRRTATLAVCAALSTGLVVFASSMKVPYVALAPGPVFDTLGPARDGSGKAQPDKQLIEIVGRESYPTRGVLDFTTVSVVDDITLPTAMRYWFDRTVAIVPRELLYPPDVPEDRVEEENKRDMTQSQTQATTAALRMLNVPVTTRVAVERTLPNQPAERVLKAGDVLTTVDGRAVTSLQQMRQRISDRRPGEDVEIGYVRAGKPTRVKITTVAASDDRARAVIGVELSEKHSYPFTVKVNVSDVGGPSAGLMLALAIYDRLTPGALTGGLHIAGTGAIDDDGNVGPIGGVQQKIIAARAAKAQYFLAPTGDCPQALAARPAGIDVIEVSSLRDALDDLRAVTSGDGALGSRINHCSE